MNLGDSGRTIKKRENKTFMHNKFSLVGKMQCVSFLYSIHYISFWYSDRKSLKLSNGLSRPRSASHEYSELNPSICSPTVYVYSCYNRLLQ